MRSRDDTHDSAMKKLEQAALKLAKGDGVTPTEMVGRLKEASGFGETMVNLALKNLFNGRKIELNGSFKIAVVKTVPTAPQIGDFYTDPIGKITCIGLAENYVVVRRAGCIPFVMSFKDWEAKRKVCVENATAQ